jgi:hypothetical protein
MFQIKRIHMGLACVGLCVGMTACVLEDPALLESEELALLEPPSTIAASDDARVELSEPAFIFAKHSGKALDVYGASAANGTNLIQWDHHGGANQVFFIEPLGDGYHRIKAKHSGLVLDVYGASTANGAQIIQWPWHGGDNQRFRFEHVGGGYYLTRAKHSGLVLDVYGVSTANGAQIIQWPWHGGDNQRWRVSPILP